MTNAISIHQFSDANYITAVKTGNHEFIIDEPTVHGGNNEGASPSAHLCAAISACTSITLKMYLERKNWSVNSIKVIASKFKNEEDKSDYFNVEVKLDGQLSDEQLNRIEKIASVCPIHKIVARGNEIELIVTQS